MMLVNQQEPDRSKPCWVLSQRGSYYGRPNIIMREFVWKASSKTWRPTGNEHREPNVLRAFKQMDWIGRLPHQGRSRSALTPGTVERIGHLLEAGLGIKRIMNDTGISRGTVQRIKRMLQEISNPKVEGSSDPVP